MAEQWSPSKEYDQLFWILGSNGDNFSQVTKDVSDIDAALAAVVISPLGVPSNILLRPDICKYTLKP